MGLRDKVTIALVIIALTQIACRHCMPRTPRKASLKRYLNDLKPVKNNPGSTVYSPSKVNKTPKHTFGKTGHNGRIRQNSLPTKSLYDTYNFPENEYPLDNAPRDRFRIGMNFNGNNHVNTLQKARNLQSSAINDLKKDMKMKRKLLTNKQVNNENIPMKTDISSIKIASDPDSVRLLDPETFPEVQYPLNTMETWGPNYWNYLPFTQEKQLNGLGQNGFNTKARESINQPFTRLTKAKASKFLQSYDKLKEEHRRTSTENSKRSNVGQKGLNFTKTATCERVSDDFITASLFSNPLGIPSDTKTLDTSNRSIANSAENTCPLIENPCQLTPLPYKVIEENFENVCPTHIELNNNPQELEDADSNLLAKTLQLIEEILLNDDNSSKEPPKNKSKEKENNVNTTENDYSGGSANKDISINLIDNAEISTVIPIEELSHEISDDAQADILPYNLPSLPEETIPEYTTLVAGPLNVKTPIPFTEPITYDALTNASSPDQTNTTILSNVNPVPGYTSIIIIPMNNGAIGKSQSHIFETTSDKPIIVHLPSTQSSSIPSHTPSLNHIVSSPLGNPVPNNQQYSDLSNMAPVQNDNPSSNALVSELLNSVSDSGSSLPIHETLPTNSKCYNNENSPSSMREKPVSDILTHKSLIDETPFVTPNCNEKWSQLPLETDKFVVNPDTPPQTLDFEHPVFDFADSDIATLSQGAHNNVINNELPIIAREINSDLQITDNSSKDLVIATQNITTGHLHKMTPTDSVSDDSLSESPNGVPTVALDKDFSSETPTDGLEILKNHLSDSLSNLFNHKSTSPSPTSNQITETPIDGMPPSFLVATPTVELPTPTEASLTPSPVFETFIEKLPEIMDTRVPPTKVSDITSERAPQPVDNTPGPSPILNSTPVTTDLIVKTELYKIRQILDRMLSSETSVANQPPSMDTTLSSILDTDSLPLLEEQSLSPIQTSTDSQPPPLDKVFSPNQTPTDSQPPPLDKVLSPIQTTTDSQPPPLDKVLSPIQTPTDSQPPPLDEVLSPIQTTTDSQPPPWDKVLSPIQTSTDSQPPPLDKVLSPIQTTSDSQPPPLDKVLSPIQTTTDSQPPPLDEVLSPSQTTTDSQPPPLDKVLSPIQTTTDSQPPPLDKVLSPIQTTTDSQPPPLDKVLSPIQTTTDSQPPPLDKVLSPIQTPTDSQPPPLDEVLSPSQTTTDSQPPPLDKVLPPIQTTTDSQPPPLDKVLSPIQTTTDSQPPPLDKVLSPIQTPTDSQPPPLEEVLSPSQTTTDSQPPPLDKVLSPIQTTTDSQPPPLDKVLSPIQTTTDSQPPPLDKVLSPIQTPTDSQPPPLDEVLSPSQTTTDSQPPPLDKVLSPIKATTDSKPPPLDKVLSPIQTPTDSQPPPLDKERSPIQTTSDSQPPPLDKVFSPIQATTDSKPPPLDKVLSPTQTPSDSQPPPLDNVLSPIQTTTDNQPPPLDKVLSPIQTPTNSQLPPLDKVLPPISDTDSLPLLEEQSLSINQTSTDSQTPPLDKVFSPYQTPTDSQPPPLDKALSPIKATTDSKPPPLDKVLSPIQTPTDSLPPPLDKVLSPIQTTSDSQPPPLDKVLSPIQATTDSKPPPLDKVLSPIQTPSDSQPPPLDKVLSPIQTTTDNQPPPLDKVLSPIQMPTDSQLQMLDKVLSRIHTPTNSQLPPLDKVLPPISDTGSLPLLEKQSLSPIQTPTDSQPPPLDKVLSPLQTPADSQSPPLDKVLSPIQTTTDNQPPPLDKVLSPIQMSTDSQLQMLDKVLSRIHTPTNSQLPPLDKVMPPISDTGSLPLLEEQSLSPIQTLTDSQAPPLVKLLSPISDTDSLPLLEKHSLSPTQTPVDSVPLIAGDNMHLPLPVSDSPFDSSQQQDHKKLLKISINDVSKDTLPSPADKSHLSNLVSDSIESPPQSLDETFPPISLFETTIDNKPYLIENLVTPLYETVTSRTKDINNNGLPYKMDESALKMDLGYPDTYEVYDDHFPLSIDDLPINMHKENSKSPLSNVDLPTDEAEAPNLLSKTPVNDLLKPTEVLSLPVERVLEIASPGFPSDSYIILLNESMKNEHQHFPPSKDAPNGLPALPTDEVRSPIHEVIPNSQSHEISSEIQGQKYDLPLAPVDKLIPDVSLPDAFFNEPFVIDNSSSPIPDKIAEIPNSTTDTKDSPLVDKRLLSPEDYASPNTLAPDIPIAVLPSLNKALQSTYLDKTTDDVLSQSTLSDLHRDDLPLSASKTLPLPDNTLTNIPPNKTLSTSKLPITKALLENVLSDITKGVLSSQVAKALPVTPPSYKTVFYVYEKSPLLETKEIPLLPVENSFPIAESNDNLIDNLGIPQITEDSPTTNLPFEFSLPIDKTYNDKLENSTDDAKGENEIETQTSHNLSDDQPLPKDKSSRLTDILNDISRNKKSSSLPITKALLENVLSEFNTQGFSIPVSKAVPYTSSSVLDKTHCNIDSPLSDFAEDSPPLPEDKILPNTANTDTNLPFSGQSQDTSSEENKTLSEIQSIDTSISTAVSSSMDKIVPNDDLPSQVTEILPFPKDTPSDSPLSSYKIQTPSSPKLLIAKALLENVLSDINTKGLSMPVAKALPVASRSLLDKTLYFLESPRPATIEESSVSDVPTEDNHHSEINEDVLPPSADKVVPDNPIIYIRTDELISGKMYEGNSDDLTDGIEASNETLFSEKLTDDFLSERGKSPDDIPDDLSVPPTKQVFSLRLPITKALLEKVLSDITDGAIHRKIP